MEVTDESKLDFVVHASESALVEQLKELLKTRDLTFDEVGLLYSYKSFGVWHLAAQLRSNFTAAWLHTVGNCRDFR